MNGRGHLMILALCLAWLTADVPCLAEPCKSGYQRVGKVCKDHDECSEDGFCGENANCTNTEGSYNCTCHKGFRTQIGVHFKADSVESRNTKCVNVIGSYKCTCDDGFEPSTGAERIGHEGICEDFNECREDGFCGENANCTNTEGSHYCTCHKGFRTKNGVNFKADSGEMCLDYNECSEDGFCGENANCTNTEGSHYCTCHKGFRTKNGVNFKADSGEMCLGIPLLIIFKHLIHCKLEFVVFQAVKGNYTCVYWEAKVGNGSWSERDCVLVQSNATHTMCSCKHLSSFAVLMSLYDIKLKLITWVGLSLSMLCLFFCILTFSLIRSIQSTRNTIHLHLCISLFIAHFIFLVGISATDNKTGCAVVAGLLQFFYLAALCWMCMEGVHLFRMVVLVFNNTIKRLYMMSGGYGIPALIVAISALSNAKGYGTERVCWLNLEDGFIWSFFGPVCIIIMVNVFFFLITVWKLAQKFSSLNPDLDKLRKIKAFTITAVAQLCVLGIMWIFGCFQFDDNTLAMSYLFTIFSSLQGALVFLMHCLLSKQVREEYVKIIERVCVPKKKYSEFSSNQSSNSKSQV
uniref:Uncharacterized protein n=1 Tax=Esox lucius TaxID=8010 RepID=A0A3P9ALX8_ESOLU